MDRVMNHCCGAECTEGENVELESLFDGVASSVVGGVVDDETLNGKDAVSAKVEQQV